jgi:GMP synthase-like glutamine amidotransferase
MRFLVLQHARVEHPAGFRALIEDAGHSWHPVHLDEGEPVPGAEALARYDALWVMGGPMDVWEEEAHPWLVPEKALVHEAVTCGMPFFGLCFGHQILAEAMGGRCAPGIPEVGVMNVALTEAGRAGPHLAGLPDPLTTLQWHGAEVAEAPPGARVLAASPACAVQAMAMGRTAFSAQFHLEVEPDTVDNWTAIPAYADALARAHPDGADDLRAEVAARLPAFAKAAAGVWRNWCAACAIPAAPAGQDA